MVKKHHEDEPAPATDAGDLPPQQAGPLDPGPQPEIPPVIDPVEPKADPKASEKPPENYDLRINELAGDTGAEDKSQGEQMGEGEKPIQLVGPTAPPNTTTVLQENPTAPTNIVCAQGYPPTTQAWAAAGAPGNPLIFAVNTVGAYLPEGSGTEVNVPFPGATNIPAGSAAGGSANSDMGNFTEFANKSHPS